MGDEFFPFVWLPELTEEEEQRLIKDAGNEKWFFEELENPRLSEDEENELLADD